MNMTNSNDQFAEKIISLMQADDSVDAPEDSVKWAKNIYRSRIAEPKTSILQKIAAVLQADLSPQKAAFGERSAAGQARQMLFEAGEHSIDLRIKEAGDAWDIRGQILGEGFANGTVEISGDDERYEARITETSEFKLTGIRPGKYNFTARGNKAELTIEDLDLK